MLQVIHPICAKNIPSCSMKVAIDTYRFYIFSPSTSAHLHQDIRTERLDQRPGLFRKRPSVLGSSSRTTLGDIVASTSIRFTISFLFHLNIPKILFSSRVIPPSTSRSPPASNILIALSEWQVTMTWSYISNCPSAVVNITFPWSFWSSFAPSDAIDLREITGVDKCNWAAGRALITRSTYVLLGYF